MLRMSVKKTYHQRNQENTICEIVISENNKNPMLDTFISMKMDAEYNENTPTISFDRFHENSEIFTKMTSNVGRVSSEIVELEKNQGQIWSQRPLKRSRQLGTLPF